MQRTSPPKARSVHVSSSSWPACGLPPAAAAAAVVPTLLAALLHVQTVPGRLCSRSQAANRRRRLGPCKRAPTRPLPHACCTNIVLIVKFATDWLCLQCSSLPRHAHF